MIRKDDQQDMKTEQIWLEQMDKKHRNRCDSEE